MSLGKGQTTCTLFHLVHCTINVTFIYVAITLISYFVLNSNVFVVPIPASFPLFFDSTSPIAYLYFQYLHKIVSQNSKLVLAWPSYFPPNVSTPVFLFFIAWSDTSCRSPFKYVLWSINTVNDLLACGVVGKLIIHRIYWYSRVFQSMFLFHTKKTAFIRIW